MTLDKAEAGCSPVPFVRPARPARWLKDPIGGGRKRRVEYDNGCCAADNRPDRPCPYRAGTMAADDWTHGYLDTMERQVEVAARKARIAACPGHVYSREVLRGNNGESLMACECGAQKHVAPAKAA